MTAPFPHRYTSTITRVGATDALIEAPPRQPLSGGPPPELGGPAIEWSPEHLLVSAIGLCLFTTFAALARREELTIVAWREVTTGVLDKTRDGLAFTGFTVAVELAVEAKDLERATGLLERAHRHCIISNALRAPVALEPHVTVATTEQMTLSEER